MTTERLDKQWREKGLSSYTTGAILGTLAHYGVQVDELLFREAAQELSFIGIARGWVRGGWKAARQFEALPLYAAGELWRRWEKERLGSIVFADRLANVVEELAVLATGSREPRLEQALAAFNALSARLPADPSEKDAFMNEVHFCMWEEIVLGGRALLHRFEDLKRVLPEKGFLDASEAYAGVVELVVPSRAGVVRAELKIHRGLEEEGSRELVAIAGDSSRAASNRLQALEVLFSSLDAYSDVAEVGRHALKDVESAGDYHSAEKIADLIGGALDGLSETEAGWDDPEIRRRSAEIAAHKAQLEEAHDRMHPDCAEMRRLGMGLPGWDFKEF